MTTVVDWRRFKAERRRFAMLTAHDYPTARMAEEAGIPVLLVGDKSGERGAGLSHHRVRDPGGRALSRPRRGPRRLQRALVGDLPFMSYQPSLERAIVSAGRLIQEGGMHAVKLGGAGPSLEVVRRLSQIGIQVMATSDSRR